MITIYVFFNFEKKLFLQFFLSFHDSNNNNNNNNNKCFEQPAVSDIKNQNKKELNLLKIKN
jgi:hypothetical protein